MISSMSGTTGRPASDMVLGFIFQSRKSDWVLQYLALSDLVLLNVGTRL